VVLSQISGRESEAESHFREALRLRPDYGDARYNLDLLLKSR
jgi:Flp pilus assembly protein TadD